MAGSMVEREGRSEFCIERGPNMKGYKVVETSCRYLTILDGKLSRRELIYCLLFASVQRLYGMHFYVSFLLSFCLS
jgi:hypothetical protein